MYTNPLDQALEDYAVVDGDRQEAYNDFEQLEGQVNSSSFAVAASVSLCNQLESLKNNFARFHTAQAGNIAAKIDADVMGYEQNTSIELKYWNNGEYEYPGPESGTDPHVLNGGQGDLAISTLIGSYGGNMTLVEQSGSYFINCDFGIFTMMMPLADFENPTYPSEYFATAGSAASNFLEDYLHSKF